MVIRSGNCKPELTGSDGENLVRRMYAAGDEAAARELDRLSREDGVRASCTAGCCHCCRFHILMNIAEAQFLAGHIRRMFSLDQIRRLHRRTRHWHEWDNSRPGRPAAVQPPVHIKDGGLSDEIPACPLLENDLCTAYPARPMVCRSHYVDSDPLLCLAASDPASMIEERPAVLSSVVAAGAPFAGVIRGHVEAGGVEFSRTLMLLPHWLAVAMGWEFAVEY